MAARLLAAAAAAVLCVQAWAGNLLRNGGFEDGPADAPDHWSVFVQPMFGAGAAVDGDVAAEGFRSVRLHTPEPYEKEPANNWSQNVEEAVAGKALRLTGAIRTLDAGYAAVWVQACTKRPFRILKQFTTSDETPIRGDQGWTRVEMTMTMPENTEFLAVRCVIQGAGTAWFDDLALTAETAAKSAAAPLSAPRTSGEVEWIEPETPVRIVRPEAPAPRAPETSRPTRPALDAGESDRAELLRLNESLQETVRELRGTNEAIAGELDAHREEIERLKADMIILRDALIEANRLAQAAAQEANGTPPLIPGADPAAERGAPR